MPFKSDRQRRYLYSQKPEIAAKFAKYNQGGSVMPGLLDKKGQDMTITIKKPNGASVTYKSPEGSQVEMDGILGGMVEGATPTPVSDNTMIRVTPGEYVVNQPAAQKYKGLLNQINDEGKQMLAMGGWTKGYANGGIVGSANMANESISQAMQNIEAAKSAIGGEGGSAGFDHTMPVNNDTFGKWLTPITGDFGRPLPPNLGGLFGGIAGFADGGEVHPGGYATDQTPIVSSANPKMKVKEFAERNGIAFDPKVADQLQGFVREAVEDWATLPDHEKAEWGSIDELIEYYLEDGYAEMGPKNPAGSSERNPDLFNQLNEDLDYIEELLDEGQTPEQIAKHYSDFLGQEVMPQDIMEITGGSAGYWKGGEVEGQPSPGAVPEEGDTYTTRGQTFYYRNGRWEYKGGSPAPSYAQTDLDKIIAKPDPIIPDQQVNPDIDELIAGAGLKEGESKNATYAKRMIQAEKTIQDLLTKGFNPSSFAQSKSEFIANLLGSKGEGGSDLLRNEDQQRWAQAVHNFTTAVLRKESGAVLGADELEKVLSTYFPKFGTEEGAYGDFHQARSDAITGFISGSGGAADPLFNYASEQLQPPKDIQATGGKQRFITAEDVLGVIGGGIGGYFTPGGWKAKGAGAAGGTTIGRGLGAIIDQWIGGKDIDLGDALTPDKADAVDALIAGSTAGLGNLIIKGVKIPGKWVKDWLTKNNTTVKEAGEELVEEFITKSASKVAPKTTTKVTGKASDTVLSAANKQGWRKLDFDGTDVFFDPNKGQWLDALGKPIKNSNTIGSLNTKYNDFVYSVTGTRP